MLKSIVRKVFPDGGELKYRTEPKLPLELQGERYEHLLKDSLRERYIHSLPKTLKDQDITVEFATPDGAQKAYWIKKYFDPEIQKDIWDILVVLDGELKTKIARKDNSGLRYIESQILQAGSEAPQTPRTLGGATENASTPRKEYE